MSTAPARAGLDHESFFHAAIATIPSSILIFDERLSVLMANSNFLDKSRGTLEGILGRRLHDIFPEAFQEIALDQQIREVIASGKALHRQRMTYRGPGVPFRVYSYSIGPLNLRHGARGAILVMDDVTDLLRLAEEVRRMQLHLASVVESAGDLIISTDPAGAIMTWNAAAERATGHLQAELRGRPLADLIEPPQNLEVARCFRAIARVDQRYPVEWSVRCRDGRVIPVSWHLARMTGSAGETIGVVIVGRNLVEQRAMEAQVQQAEKLAALGRAIGGIAHEIRNPLGVSYSAAQLLRHCADAPAMLDACIAKVIGGIDRASTIVESLLRFARPGRITDTTRVDILEVLRNASMLAAGEAAAGTTVEWELAPLARPVHAEGVQNLLELVVINLILNAFQAMPEGGRLTIGLRLEAADIVVEISDTGAGIPEADRSKVFDPFFTTDSDGRRSGLGLSVSHSIVRQHGGSLTLTTVPRAGTTFTVRLPLAHDAAGAPLAAAPAPM